MLEDAYFSEKSVPAQPCVLLTDTQRNPGSARLAIGLHNAGCRVSGVCPTRGHPLLYTAAVERTFPYSGFSPLESVEAAITATKPDIVIPCDDRAVQHLHELHAQALVNGTNGRAIADVIEHSLGPPASYPVVGSRYELLKLAREQGIRVPATIPIRTADDLRTWSDTESFPVVLKAEGTYGGLGVRIAHSLKEAEQIFLKFNRPHRTRRVIKRLIVNRDPFWIRPWWKRQRPAVIAQAHIQGRPANCAVACWKGRVLAGIGVEVLTSEGSTGPANVVRVVDSPDMMTAAEKIAQKLGLSGIFGLDFMIEQQTGAAYLIEMNPRCTPLCHFQLGKGRDMVSALWSQLSGQPLPEVPPVTQNDVITYFPQAHAKSIEQSSYYDIPKGEPDLVRELLRPWPDRSLLFRLGHILTSFPAQKSPDL